MMLLNKGLGILFTREEVQAEIVKTRCRTIVGDTPTQGLIQKEADSFRLLWHLEDTPQTNPFISNLCAGKHSLPLQIS